MYDGFFIDQVSKRQHQNQQNHTIVHKTQPKQEQQSVSRFPSRWTADNELYSLNLGVGHWSGKQTGIYHTYVWLKIWDKKGIVNTLTILNVNQK